MTVILGDELVAYFLVGDINRFAEADSIFGFCGNLGYTVGQEGSHDPAGGRVPAAGPLAPGPARLRAVRLDPAPRSARTASPS